MPTEDSRLDTASIEPFYHPRSIAIVGASSHPMRPGGRPLTALRDKGYPGEIYPVNPRHQEIAGMRCYPSLLDLPEDVDMAIISVPAADVLEVLEQCAVRKVKVAVIFSAGFAEIGGEGAELQRRLTERAHHHGIRILGPNSLGLINLNNSVMASFAYIMDLEPASPKTLGFVTQSGAFGAMMFAEATQAGVGFTSFASVGNEADTDFADFAAYLLESDDTQIVGGYLEGTRDGVKLREVAERALELEKPMLVLKVGRTGAGARAASSHTGSLAGDDQVYDAFFRQTGIVRIEDLSELIAFAILHRCGRSFAGKRLGILSGSGGHGVLMADRAESLGLEVPEITGETRERLKEILPAFGSARNPVDLTAQAGRDRTMLTRCLAVMVADDNIDIVLAQTWFHGRDARELADQLIEIHRSTEKPIVLLSGMRSDSEIEKECYELVKEAGIPILTDGLQAAQAMAHLAWYQSKAGRVRAAGSESRAGDHSERNRAGLPQGTGPLTELEAKQLLGRSGIPVTREALATSADEAVEQARQMGYPVALKVLSADILHKTEAGGIALDLATDHAVREAHDRILANARGFAPDARIEGVLVQEMIQTGTELIVGATRDPIFGHVILFGLGGIFVEALRDVSLRVVPLSRLDAEEMIDEIRGRRVLDGLRGQPPADREAVVEAILSLSRLVSEHGDEIEELDINPLMVFPDGVKAVDALITRRRRGEASEAD